METQSIDMSGSTADREILIERLIRAPRRLVWRAWAEQASIERWWGPQGFTTTTHQRDFSLGGTWRFTMHGPDGRDYENRIVFRAVVEPERMTYDHFGEGDTSAISFHSTITFMESSAGTLVRLRMIFPSAGERDLVVREYGAIEGGEQTLARLEEVVMESIEG